MTSASFAGVFDVERGDLQFFGQRGRQIDDLLELVERVAGERGQLDRRRALVLEGFDLRDQVRVVALELDDADPFHALNQHPNAFVGKLQHPVDARDTTELVQMFQARVFELRVFLQGDPDQPVAGHHIVDQTDRTRTGSHQRRHHVRKNHHVAQRQYGQVRGDGLRGERALARRVGRRLLLLGLSHEMVNHAHISCARAAHPPCMTTSPSRCELRRRLTLPAR